MFNTTNRNEHRGALGLAVEGVEVYLPLSGGLCLGCLCPTLEAMIREADSRAGRLGAPISFKEWREPLEGQKPLGLEPQGLNFFNSLQVINSERFVFSADGRWDLVREMVESDPDLKTGSRFTVA